MSRMVNDMIKVDIVVCLKKAFHSNFKEAAIGH